MSKLAGLLAQADRGDGQIALITAPPACGKTALLTAFGCRVAAAGGKFVHIMCSRDEQHLNFGVLEQVARAAGLAAELAGRLLGPDSGTAAGPWPGEPAGPADAGPRATGPAWAGQEVCGALLGLAQHHPLVIAVDDLWDADPASLDCLLYLSKRLRGTRLMLVFTESLALRPPRPQQRAELFRYPFCTAISLPLLTAPGVAALVATFPSLACAPDFAPGCYRTTGGNPLLVRALAEEHLRSSAGRRAGAPATPRLGAAFAQTVLGCLYRHDEAVRLVARGLAVLGAGGRPELAARVAGLPGEAAAAAIRLLDASGLVNGAWFRHPDIARAILDDVEPSELRRLHQQAATLLHQDGAPPEVTATQLVRAGGSEAAWSVPVLRAAAERALAAADPGTARACLRLAGSTGGADDERAATTAMLVRVQWPASPQSVLGHLTELTDAAAAGRLDATVALALVPYLLWHGKVREAAEAVRGAAASAGPLTGSAAAQFHLAQRMLSWFGLQPAPEQAAGAPAAMPPAGLVSSVTPELQAITVLSEALSGALRAGVRGAEQILQRCELEGTALGPVTAALGALLCAGHADAAAGWSELFLHQPVQHGQRVWPAILRAVRAEAALRTGDLTGAEDHARTALAALPLEEWGTLASLPLATLLLAATETGDFDQASHHLTVPIPAATLDTPVGALYLRARGRYYLATGRHQAALSDFRSCAQLLNRHGLSLAALVPWRLEMARALICLGDQATAARLISEHVRHLPGRGAAERGAALRLLAATVPPARRIALLKEATDCLQQGTDRTDRVELAHALADLGLAMEQQGDSARAGMLIRRAYELGRSCGAKLLCRGLVFNGPGPEHSGQEPAADAAGVVLNEGERAVAILAAQGQTNREIASKLFITVSTVEQRLTRVYRKLRIKRRAELPIGLADPAENYPAASPLAPLPVPGPASAALFPGLVSPH